MRDFPPDQENNFSYPIRYYFNKVVAEGTAKFTSDQYGKAQLEIAPDIKKTGYFLLTPKTAGKEIRLVQDASRNGMDGLVFWDAGGHFNPNLTEIMRRMGDWIWVMSLNPAKFDKQPSFALRELDGFIMDKYWSWMGA